MNYKNNQIVVEIKIISILERINAPTPKFFRVLRNIGLCLVAAGGVLVATPIAIPAAIVALGGYLIVAGSVATVVAQTAVEKNNK
jgi:ABC-type xylose transport system permease subunit